MFLHRILPYLCFLGAPVLARIVLINTSDSGLMRADIAGFFSDLAVALIAAFLYTLAAFKTRILGAVIILLWCCIHQANFEHVAANGGLVSLAYLGHLFDPTFFFGSAMTLSNLPLTAAIVILSFAALIMRPARPTLPAAAFAAAVVLIATGGQLRFSSLMDPRWRRVDVVQAHAEDLWYSIAVRKTGGSAMTGAAKARCDSLLGKNLSGESFVPLNKGGCNVLLVILEGCCGGMLPSLAAFQGVISDIAMTGLDSIARHHLSYANFVTHQRQTNRGEFSILSGTYPKLNSSTPKMTECVSLSRGAPLDSRRFLPSFLASHGYETTYLQAAPLPYMLKDAFMARAGFRHVHGTEWFTHPYATGYWGVDDRTFFEQAFDLIQSKKNLKSPWFITLLTVGTHHPVTIPSEYGDPAKESIRVRGFRYLDGAVRNFIAKLDSLGVLNNTLTIITCDESRGIAGKNRNPALELLFQQWGFCIVLLPGPACGMLIDEPCASSDLALSVTDYLGLPAENTLFGGRSMFRRYGSGRDLYFANTFGSFTGRFTAENHLDVCSENLRQGVRYSAEAERLFSLRRMKTGALSAEALNEIGWFAALSNASVLDPSAKNRTFDFYTGTTHALFPGKQYDLLTGQNISLPKNSYVSVRYRGRILPGDSCSVFLKHDLASRCGSLRIVEYMPAEAASGDTFSAAYGFYCNESYSFTEFRATAEVIKGAAASVILDEASLSYTRRPPTAEERKMYFKPFDKKIGRNLGAVLTVRGKR